MNTFNLRTRQELIGNNLMEVVCDYPDQIRPIIDELVDKISDNSGWCIKSIDYTSNLLHPLTSYL